MALAVMAGTNADCRGLGIALTGIDGAEVFKRVHGGLLGIVQLLSLRAPAENPDGALVAAKAHLSVLEGRRVLVGIRGSGGSRIAYYTSLGEDEGVLDEFALRGEVETLVQQV
jgi:hypothetical protein